MGKVRTGRIRPGLATPVPVRAPRPSDEHEPAPCGASGSREGQRQGAPSSRHRTSGGSRHQLGIKGSTLGSRRIRGASLAPRADSDKRRAPEQHYSVPFIPGWPGNHVPQTPRRLAPDGLRPARENTSLRSVLSRRMSFSGSALPHRERLLFIKLFASLTARHAPCAGLPVSAALASGRNTRPRHHHR
jgi:hypothetical protein